MKVPRLFLSLLAALTLLSIANFAKAGEIPSQPPKSINPIRTAHFTGQVMFSTLTGMTYPPNQKVCTFDAEIPVFDVLKKNESFELKTIKGCNVTVNGVTKELMIVTVVSLDKDWNGNPEKTFQVTAILGDDFLETVAAGSPDLLSKSLNLSFSKETYTEKTRDYHEFILVNLSVDDVQAK